MKTPKIREIRFWSPRTVRDMCIKHDFYTCGDNDEYFNMLELTRKLKPTKTALYTVAKDIVDHSEEGRVEEVMYLLELEAVHTYYEIEE